MRAEYNILLADADSETRIVRHNVENWAKMKEAP